MIFRIAPALLLLFAATSPRSSAQHIAAPSTTPAIPRASSPHNEIASRTQDAVAAGRRLLAAYPSQLAGVAGTDLIWRDGTRMRLDDGTAPKSSADWLRAPDLKDMFRYRYPTAAEPAAPERDFDPGRARNAAFFRKMYGDCTAGAAKMTLADVAWLPKHSKARLKVSPINGVAEKLAAVSAALDELPSHFMPFLLPSAGTFNCRPIAGTNAASAHGYGIAIDIAVKPSDYWRWSKQDATGAPVWKNRIPMEIVRVFEAHGFIWGGRWSHYDTMHFEYRPELFLP